MLIPMKQGRTIASIVTGLAVWLSGAAIPRAESLLSVPIQSISADAARIELAVDPQTSTSELEVLYSTNLLLGNWKSAGKIQAGASGATWSGELPSSAAFFVVRPAKASGSARSSSAAPASAGKTAPVTSPAPAAASSKAGIRATIISYEAWRRYKYRRVADSKKYSPGLLVTPNADGSGWNPREARLIFKAVPGGRGLTRHIHVSTPGLLEYRNASENRPAWVPRSREVKIPGPVNRDYATDVAMRVTDAWARYGFVRLDYFVRDSRGRIVARDKIRLLAPVIMAVGDSVTQGFMRDIRNIRLTPPVDRTGPWSSKHDWSRYPDVSDWRQLYSPWNRPNHRKLIKYQGYRGFLKQKLPGFAWRGEDVNGHGPAHMGYTGAHLNHINRRMPMGLIRKRCYAIVIYFGGFNDAMKNKSAEAMYKSFKTGVQAIASSRRNCGKTLVIGATLPRITSYYRGYTAARQTELARYNRKLRGYNFSIPNARYRCADLESVSHGTSFGTLDDGLHFFPPGNKAMASRLTTAIRNGLR